MTSLISQYNKQSKDIFNKTVLQEQLYQALDSHLKELCPVRNAAVWIDILDKLTQLEGFVSDTIIEGIIKQSVKKNKDKKDTQDLLFSAIHYAQHFNYKKAIDYDVFSVISGVPVTRESLEVAPQPGIIRRMSW